MAGMNRNYDELEKKIGYQFKDINLLITALTHTSFANEIPMKDWNFWVMQFWNIS